MFMKSSCKLELLVALTVFTMPLGAKVLRADIYNVTRLDDPAPDGCAVGDCSLREAVIASNASAGADTINLPAGTYTLTIAGAAGADDTDPAVGDLDIGAGGLTVSGAGAGSTIINASGLAHRAFAMPIDLLFIPTSVSFNNLTITGGNTSGLTGALNRGGAIDVGSRHATVTLTGVVITANTSGSGGGIRSNGNLTITGSTISGNTGTGVKLAADGTNYRTLTINTSTVSGNSGTGVDVDAGTCNITNSTISGNGASGFSGGVDYGGGLTLGTLTNVTIANNRYGYIGQNDAFGDPAVTVRNTILSGSAVRDIFSLADASFARSPTSGGNNLIGDTSGTAFTQPTDKKNVNPQLSPLAVNSPGTTATHALSVTSPALDSASAAFAPATDQRGVNRPQGSADDIGAYELIPPDDDGDGFSPPADCNDNDATIHPGATEIPDDGIDQNCNGFDTVTCHVDADLDGVGSSSTVLSTDGDCTDAGEATSSNDCDDGNANVGAPATLYEDADGDGAGDPNSSIVGCPQAGYVANANDQCPADPGKVTQGLCGCGNPETDSDGDGTPDCVDGCPSDPLKIAPGSCGCGVADTDTDSDGTPNCLDLCPNDPLKIAPGACGCGVADTDADSDGTPNCNDGCPNDPAKIAPGTCGCGVADTDTDADGTPNCNDGCPTDPAKTAPGSCGCGAADTDTDADGTPNCNDGCPNDPNKTQPGTAGCGNAEPVTGPPADPPAPAPTGDVNTSPQPTTNNTDACSSPLTALLTNLTTCGTGCPLMILSTCAGFAGMKRWNRPRRPSQRLD